MSATFKWIGGAMFVASLAFWVFWYVVELGRPSPGGGATAAALLVDGALFAVFAGHHSLLAREAVKRGLSFIPSHLIRSLYVWTASVLLFAVCVWWRPIGGSVYRVAWPGAIAFAAVQIAGIWLSARSVGAINALELAGIRPPRRPDGGLQTSGPYRVVRHPLYLGWMLFVFGAANMTADRLAFATISSAYLVAAVPWEERSLRKSFGNAYANYARTVRWRIIPYVY